MMSSLDNADFYNPGPFIRAFEGSSDAVEINDIEGSVLYVNEAWRTLFQQDRGDPIRADWAAFDIDDLEQDEMKRLWEECLASGRSQGVLRLSRTREAISYVRTLYRNAKGVPTAVITIYRLLAPEDYEHSPLLLALLSARRDGVAILDSDGRVLATSSAFTEMIGIQEPARPGTDIRSVLPGVQEALLLSSQEVFWWTGNIEVSRRDDTSIWASVEATRDNR